MRGLINLVGGQPRVRVSRCVGITIPKIHLMACRFLGSWCGARVAIFACTTALGKILSTDYVWKRGIIVVDWCVCLVFNGLCHKGFSIC